MLRVSQLLTLERPSHTRTWSMPTARGEFAVLDTAPMDAAPYRGVALLVPGFLGSKEDFLPLLSGLSEGGYRVVALDGRGQYETGAASSEPSYTQVELARDVMAVARRLDAGAVHLLGHSYGGMIARAAVLDSSGDRSLWASLTLMNVGPGPVSAGQRERLGMLLTGLESMSPDELWPFVRQRRSEAAEEVREFLHRRWLANVPAHLAAAAGQMRGETDRTPQLARIDLPKAVLSGSPDGTWSPEEVEEMAHRLGARLVPLPGGGHSPNVHLPDETASALVDFWDRSAASPR
ncbi:alpha/beta hydrolase [Streptomyces sp. NBC_01498]|uniref:alpha/beta fold hydrolase n=1 Tax=Streptomyces sp. NBC_01498 TaxID=2975870 RepID=UPI002E7BED22|nr:alpha/beta hydrolase [Streptomyces sp. NBC_01498]WTL28648.1 alpha/beta hydrolase [Streptomyces sp. NBC_01498]